ncbi:MAG: site-specific integrase [Streptococcaceae bacterium]|nr:site-specific integrase [Streptococcaceae bacterium]
MLNKNQLFYEYFAEWLSLYKNGAIRPITLQKYQMTLRHLKTLAPTLKLFSLNRQNYQKLINKFAENHERTTVSDFNTQLKASLLDALDDGLIKYNPARKVIIKGICQRQKKQKFLNQQELCQLMQNLDLGEEINWDWFIYLIAKTGLRFAEALALTKVDFDLLNQTILVNKTWNYKSPQGSFHPTKNKFSNRTISIDQKTAQSFGKLLDRINDDSLIFVKGRVFNATINQRLAELCKIACIPTISLHGLRHTHASLLIYADVSIANISKRLGHSNITTTQEIYLHIIRELEIKDNGKIIDFLGTI